MSRTGLAFVVTPLAASLLYWWFALVEHYVRNGVPLYSPFGLLVLVVLFSYAGAFLLAVPIYLLLRSIGAATPIPLLVSGTLLGWLFISLLNTGKPWLHPEAFATGLFAAGAFLLIRRAP